MPASSSAPAGGGGEGEGGAGVGGAGRGRGIRRLGRLSSTHRTRLARPVSEVPVASDPVERDREVEQHVVERVLVGRVARRVERRDELAAEAVHRAGTACRSSSNPGAPRSPPPHEGADEASHRALGSLQSHGGALAPQAQPRAVEAGAHPAEVGLDRRLAHVQRVGCRVHVEPVRRVDEVEDEACQASGGGALGGVANACATCSAHAARSSR